MKDYTNELGFWKRLESFASDVQTGCCAGEEEKEMIMHCCKLKILDLQNVSKNKVAFCPECGCNKLQHDYGKHHTCLNVLCDWQGQTDC